MYLSVQSDCIWLAFGTNTTWPGRMFIATRFYFTANVFQIGKFPSRKRENNFKFTTEKINKKEN